MHTEILLGTDPVVESGTFSTEGLTNRAIDISEALSLPGHCVIMLFIVLFMARVVLDTGRR